MHPQVTFTNALELWAAAMTVASMAALDMALSLYVGRP